MISTPQLFTVHKIYNGRWNVWSGTPKIADSLIYFIRSDIGTQSEELKIHPCHTAAPSPKMRENHFWCQQKRVWWMIFGWKDARNVFNNSIVWHKHIRPRDTNKRHTASKNAATSSASHRSSCRLCHRHLSNYRAIIDWLSNPISSASVIWCGLIFETARTGE